MRQTADELGKRAALKIEGAQGEMDRNLLERMKAPFEHMLRNALAHGIETPARAPRRRQARGRHGQASSVQPRRLRKSCCASPTTARAWTATRIREKAIERGLMRADAQLSDRDLFGFVLETGFSTAEHGHARSPAAASAWTWSHSEISQLGGSLAIDSSAARARSSRCACRSPSR